MATTTLILDGSKVTDLTAFFREADRLLLHGQDWQLGESLDALYDVLHGGFGVHAPGEKITIVWTQVHQSRIALGYPATIVYLEKRLADPRRNTALFQRRLNAARAETGRTLFDLLLHVFIDHPQVSLLLE